MNRSKLLSSENVNCTSNTFAWYWMGSQAYIVNVCAKTNHIVMMLRMPCKHSIWSGALDVSQENSFCPFLYSENAKKGWYLLPKRPFDVSQRNSYWMVDTYVHTLFGKDRRLCSAQPEAGRRRRYRFDMKKCFGLIFLLIKCIQCSIIYRNCNSPHNQIKRLQSGHVLFKLTRIRWNYKCHFFWLFTNNPIY